VPIINNVLVVKNPMVGLRYVVEWMKHPACQLYRLDLACNPIGGDGAHVLAAMLRENHSLIELDQSFPP
jgi:hypothetical protein